jgi:hypothetical protein
MLDRNISNLSQTVIEEREKEREKKVNVVNDEKKPTKKKVKKVNYNGGHTFGMRIE